MQRPIDVKILPNAVLTFQFFLLVLLAVEVVLLKQVFEYLDSILKRFGVLQRHERFRKYWSNVKK